MTITENLLTVNPYSRPGTLRSEVQALVMHWTAAPRQLAVVTRDFWEARKDGRNGYGSAHYIIGEVGDILRCIPEREVAYHCGVGTLDDAHKDPSSGRFYTDWARAHFGEANCQPAPSIGPNICTLGIEMEPVDSFGNFTQQTLSAAIELAADICARLGLNPLADITTHHAIVGWKDCPRLWVNNPFAFDDFRSSVAGLSKPSASAVENERTGK